MKEQQSGLGPKTDRHYARHLPPLSQQHIIAQARRQAAYEAEYEAEEADQSYGGHFAGIHPEHRPSLSGALSPISTGRSTPSAHTRASVPVEVAGDGELEEDESYYTTRLPSSARRYQVSPAAVYQQGNRRYHVGYVSIPPRQSRHAQLPPRQRYSDEGAPLAAPAKRSKRRVHPLLYLGVGMLAMGALFLLLSSAASWVREKRDDVTYGRPRT